MNHQNPNQQTDFHEFPKPSDPFDYSPSNNNNIQITNMYQNFQMTPPRHQISDQRELIFPFSPTIYSPGNNSNIQTANMYQNFQMTPPRHQISDQRELIFPFSPTIYSPGNNSNIQTANMYQNFQMTPPRHQILDQRDFQRLPLPFEPLPDTICDTPFVISKEILEKQTNARKKKKINEIEVYSFYSNNGYNATIRKFGIGHARLKKIIQNKGKYEHKKKRMTK